MSRGKTSRLQPLASLKLVPSSSPHGSYGSGAGTHSIDSLPDTVYFAGDTSESDIRGTNKFDSCTENSWYSILARTSVFQEGTKPRFAPKATVDNVLEAVKHGMEREYKEALKASSINVDGVQGSAIEE